MNPGKVFKQERERLGLTIREMAASLNITKSALWKIEAGRNYPKNETVNRLCQAASIPIAYFYQQAMTIEDYAAPGRATLIIEDGVVTE